jgi:hypothetical protein
MVSKLASLDCSPSYPSSYSSPFPFSSVVVSDSLEKDDLPNFNVVRFFFSGDNFNTEMTILDNGSRLYIFLCKESFTELSSLKERYLSYFKGTAHRGLDDVMLKNLYD